MKNTTKKRNIKELKNVALIASNRGSIVYAVMIVKNWMNGVKSQ